MLRFEEEANEKGTRGVAVFWAFEFMENMGIREFGMLPESCNKMSVSLTDVTGTTACT